MKKNLTIEQKTEISDWFMNHDAYRKAPKKTVVYLNSILNDVSNQEGWHVLDQIYKRTVVKDGIK